MVVEYFDKLSITPVETTMAGNVTSTGSVTFIISIGLFLRLLNPK